MPLAFHNNIRAKGTDFYFNSDNQQSNTLSQNVFIEDFFCTVWKNSSLYLVPNMFYGDDGM